MDVATISPSTFRALTCKSTLSELISTPSFLITKVEPVESLDTSSEILSTVWSMRLCASLPSILPLICVRSSLAVISRFATLPFTSPISLWMP